MILSVLSRMGHPRALCRNSSRWGLRRSRSGPARRGGRVLGGAMSWDTPKKLAPFDGKAHSSFAVPDEVTVSRQVLAEPDPGLSAKTWAQLSDGTPLVTAARQGKGMIILFHLTADTTWSNLPLSGLFVDMLRKIIACRGKPRRKRTRKQPAARGPAKAALAPNRTLDGFGYWGRRHLMQSLSQPGFEGAALPELRRAFMVRPMGLSPSMPWNRKKPS